MTRFSPLFVIVMIWAVSLGAAAQFGKFAVMLDRVAASYPLQSAPMIGLAVSSVGFAGLVLGTTAGLFASGLGYRRVMVVALIAGSALSFAQSLGPSFPLLLALRGLEGFAHLAIVVAAPVLTAQVASPRFQAAAMTLYSSFFSVSFMVLGFIGPGVVDRFGVAGLLQGHAAYLMAGALVMALVLPRDVPGRLPLLSLRGLWRDHIAIYASPSEAAPAMGFVCYTITYVAFLTLMPQQFLGQPEQVLLAVFMPLVSIVVSMTLGIWAMQHVSAVRVVQAGFVASVLFALLLWLVWDRSALMLLAAYGVAGGLGLVQSASFAAIAQLNPGPEARGRAAGAIAQLGNVGTTSGTPLLIFLIGQAGPTGLTLFLIGFSVLGIAVHSLQARRRITALPL